MSDISTKPKASFAPVYASIYPELAEIARGHGYALAIHGSLARDFDLVAIPWGDFVSPHDVVVAGMCHAFAMSNVKGPTPMNHGRVCYTLVPKYGHTWFLDLSFTPAVESKVEE